MFVAYAQLQISKSSFSEPIHRGCQKTSFSNTVAQDNSIYHLKAL